MCKKLEVTYCSLGFQIPAEEVSFEPQKILPKRPEQVFAWKTRGINPFLLRCKTSLFFGEFSWSTSTSTGLFRGEAFGDFVVVSYVFRHVIFDQEGLDLKGVSY